MNEQALQDQKQISSDSLAYRNKIATEELETLRNTYEQKLAEKEINLKNEIGPKDQVIAELNVKLQAKQDELYAYKKQAEQELKQLQASFDSNKSLVTEEKSVLTKQVNQLESTVYDLRRQLEAKTVGEGETKALKDKLDTYKKVAFANLQKVMKDNEERVSELRKENNKNLEKITEMRQ